MPKVAVVTDSAASIPEPLIKSLDINWVAYYIHRGQEVLRDLVTVQREEFYKWLLTADVLPKTASPGPGDYIKMYEDLAKNKGVKEIVSIHMTSKGSGAYQAAIAARDMITEKIPELKIEVIDTLNVSMCQGWMVIEAAKSALQGKSLSEITNLVYELIPLTRMIQTADTLRYLYMGGRIGKAKHLLASLMNIKPLIGMENGEIIALGKARSTKKAYENMTEMIVKNVGENGKIKVAFVHAAAIEELQKLKSMVEKRLCCVETMITELAPSLGVHSGPGTTGLCYYPV